jgi:hypothetical protein
MSTDNKLSQLMLPVSHIKQRGWTDALITRFVGNPDHLVTNPAWQGGPKIRLYYRSRVAAAEALPEFIEAKAKKQGKTA